MGTFTYCSGASKVIRERFSLGHKEITVRVLNPNNLNRLGRRQVKQITKHGVSDTENPQGIK